MSTLEDLANAKNMTDFVKALQQNHLAQVIAAKYEANPLLLGEHYAINLTPAPPGADAPVDDPAKMSMVLIISVKPGYKSAVFGNLCIPENVQGNLLPRITYKMFTDVKNYKMQPFYLDWSQHFELMYQLSGWTMVELDVGYLTSSTGDSVEDMQWNLFVKPDAPVDTVVYQLAACLKSLQNVMISDRYNSFVLALLDNRPQISSK